MKPIVTTKETGDLALFNMANAARLCYGKEEEMTKDERCALLERVLKRRHFSILEHGHLSFKITGVTRNFTHQFVRHRHISFAQQSFHYTVAKDVDHPENPSYTHGQCDLMETAFTNAFMFYNELMKIGMPKEEARHVLPTGMSTKIMATASIRQWMQFVQIRSCSVNCWEIREVTKQIRFLLSREFSFLTPYLGPSCFVNDTCYEGVKSCGRTWRENETQA